MSATKWEESPTPGRPVVVDFGLNVEAIQNIDARSGLTSVVLSIGLYWTDPRVAEACKRDQGWEPPAELWAPGVWLANGMDEEEQLTYTNRPGHRVRVRDRARGLLFVVSCSVPLRLHRMSGCSGNDSGKHAIA